MKHQEAFDELGSFRDNELSPARRDEVRIHLNGCVQCQEASQKWEMLARVFFRPQKNPTPSQIEGFTLRVMAQVKKTEQKENPFFKISFWRVLFPVLEFATAAFFVFLIFNQAKNSTPMDALLLVNSQDKSLAELVLPPDINGENNLLASVMEGK